jgi:predicted HTH domain antitoxin
MSATVEAQGFPGAVPEDFEMAFHLTRSELEHHLRLMAALKMFELGQVSSGKAAELAGMSRVDFLHTCGRYKVSVFNVPLDEAEAEIRRELEFFAGPSGK